MQRKQGKMNRITPLCLIKIGEKEYMQELVEYGALFFQRLSIYQELEQKERGDPNENLSQSLQPDKIKVTINNRILSDLAGPVQIRIGGESPLAYCMYSITSDHLGVQDGNYIDQRCFEFGNTAVVITDGTEFFNRIVEACKLSNLEIKGQLVEYVDFNSFHGEMGPFKKYEQWFKHQSEFRFILNSDITEDSFKLKIGSIKDITQIQDVEELNKVIKINV